MATDVPRYPRVRSPVRHDISGAELPTNNAALGNAPGASNPVQVVFPPDVQPNQDASQFILSWSLLAPANATTPLFVLDVNNNIVNGAAMQLPSNTRARIAGVVIEGETPLGNPVLQFSIRTSIDGSQRLNGWGGVNLPGRGGIVSLGIDTFVVVPTGSFWGVFVQNSDAAQHYAAVTIQGWLL